MVQIWDAATGGQPLQTISAHRGAVYSPAVRPDGRQFATGGSAPTAGGSPPPVPTPSCRFGTSPENTRFFRLTAMGAESRPYCSHPMICSIRPGATVWSSSGTEARQGQPNEPIGRVRPEIPPLPASSHRRSVAASADDLAAVACPENLIETETGSPGELVQPFRVLDDAQWSCCRGVHRPRVDRVWAVGAWLENTRKIGGAELCFSPDGQLVAAQAAHLALLNSVRAVTQSPSRLSSKAVQPPRDESTASISSSLPWLTNVYPIAFKPEHVLSEPKNGWRTRIAFPSKKARIWRFCATRPQVC